MDDEEYQELSDFKDKNGLNWLGVLKHGVVEDE